MRRRAAAVLLIALTACGGTAAATGTPGKRIRPLPVAALSGAVAGLEVQVEDVGSTVKQFQRSYADAISVYSLRERGLLQATLQVSRFTDAARLRRPSFRRDLVDKVSSGTHAQVIRVDRTDVNVTRAPGQRLFVWFTRHDVLVLSVREAYRGRYALLRAVVDGART
jgi:hypothetical protein